MSFFKNLKIGLNLKPILITVGTSLFIGGLIGFGTAWKYQDNKFNTEISNLNLKISNMKLDYANIIIENNKTIDTLNSNLSKITQKHSKELEIKNNEIENTKKRHLSMLNSGDLRLRQRPEATANPNHNEAPNSAGITATGSASGINTELSTETSKWLIEYAADAERTNQGLKQCIQIYDDVKHTIDEQFK